MEFAGAVMSSFDVKMDKQIKYAGVVLQFIYIYTKRQNKYKTMLIAGLEIPHIRHAVY